MFHELDDIIRYIRKKHPGISIIVWRMTSNIIIKRLLVSVDNCAKLTIIFTIENASYRQELAPEESIVLFVDKHSSSRTRAFSILFGVFHSTFSACRTKNLCIFFVSKTCSYMNQMIIENIWNFIDCWNLPWIRIFPASELFEDVSSFTREDRSTHRICTFGHLTADTRSRQCFTVNV